MSHTDERVTRDAGPAAPQLHGATLALVRTLWLVIVGAVSVSFLIGVPQDLASASRVCENGCLFTPATVNALAAVGIPFVAYIRLSLILALLIFLVALTMSILLFVRRSHEWMALLISCYVAVYPLNNILGAFNTTSGPPLWYGLIAVAISAIGVAPFLLFPSGRFVPSWSWVILIGWVVFWVAFNIYNLDFPLGYLIVYASFIGCQVYRYRRVSTPVERQQTKWILLGFVASLVANQAFWTPFYLPPMMPLAQTLYTPIAYLVFQVSLLFVPVAFFIAIQRYRLFDIDILINRALVYGSLTVLLAAIYGGSVFGLQTVVRLITGQDSPIAIVASTLLIAALFTPLRRQLQRIIDQRFYRDRYDAAAVIADFGATLRTEVELDQLTRNLVDVVHTTMHPTHASLWLREPENKAESPSP